MKTIKSRFARTVCVVAAGSLATLSSADAAEPTQTAERAGTQLEEIIVTAERRSQNLLSVANSVSAISGEQLTNSGIQALADLQFTTPGYTPSNGFGFTQIYVRGIGNNIYLGADPAVATYIDGVPRIYGTMENNFVNLERVEVLKGAQGGLYGRNATGGVVNIITRQPDQETAMHGRVSYGSDDTFEASAYFNLPISESVAWNLAVARLSHDPYIENLAQPNPYSAANFPNGSYLGTPQETADFFNSAVEIPDGMQNQNFWAVDSKLRVEIGDDLTVTLAGDYNRKKDSNGTGVINKTPEVLRATASYVMSLYGIDANFPAGFFPTSDKDFAGFYGLGDPESNLTDYGGSATGVLNLSKADLTFIGAYRRNDTTYIADGAYNSPPFIPEEVRHDKKYWYGEVRLTSTDAGRLQFVGGATYLDTKFDGSTVIAYFAPLPAPAANTVTQAIENWSVYAQAGYDFTDTVNLTTSARYIHETNKASFTTPPVSNDSLSLHAFLPSATLSYKLPRNGVAYARWARGWKAGGMNLVDRPSLFPTDYGKQFDPEEVDTYEIGYRQPLFGGSVQLTSAIFYNDYKNLQTATTGNALNPGIVLAIVNAGKAETYGAEASLLWRTTPSLTLGASVGYLEAEYVSFRNQDGSVLNTFDFSGKQMIMAPKWQHALTTDLDKPITSNFRLIGSALVSYSAKTVFYLSAVSDVADPSQGSYWLANLKLGLRTHDDKYEFAVFGRNITDQVYYTTGNTGPLGNTFVYGNPRVVGGEFSVRF